MKSSAIVLISALALSCSAALAAQGGQPPEPATKHAPATPAAPAIQLINLNTATATQIATLPGIGPKAAELIVQYRLKNSGFKKIEEIMNVRGVGEKTFLKLKSRITVNPAS
ncbi:MAG: helix-hairpin-helix domain-containing protein [Vicinamibacterales bacterium]|nr:helix-hairpin-helix domain-containing protein [Vicinamibacterales bacterium]